MALMRDVIKSFANAEGKFEETLEEMNFPSTKWQSPKKSLTLAVGNCNGIVVFAVTVCSDFYGV